MLFTCCLLSLSERDETAPITPDHNATALAEVDKRVKRRLLMGKTLPQTIKVETKYRDRHQRNYFVLFNKTVLDIVVLVTKKSEKHCVSL